MAKKSWIERNQRKERTVVKYAERRAELKAAGDYAGLALLPRKRGNDRRTQRSDRWLAGHGFRTRAACEEKCLCDGPVAACDQPPMPCEGAISVRRIPILI